MRRGFFAGVDLSASRTLQVLRQPACADCGMYKSCLSPKMPARGDGRRRILVVGEAPGRVEDEQGRPFVGESGRLLQDAMRRCGVEMSADCRITNSLRCRPPGNRLPEDPRRLIEDCRPYLLAEIKDRRPDVIILLGGVAVQGLIGWLWREDSKGIMRWAGWRIPSVRLNAWVCPVYHPSYVLRESRGGGESLAGRIFQQHVEAACSLSGRPWAHAPPDDRSLVDVEMDDVRASEAIGRMAGSGIPLAFDFETDRLKPDHPEARIVACSLSDGVRSLAFPWMGRAVAAMREYLLGPLPKIGYNVRFEDRWTRRVFGAPVNNFVLDGMLAAHVLDSRPDTKSLKFQSFVRLGVDGYDGAVKPFLVADGGNVRNRIDGMRLDKLLLYCGLDSLYERRLADVYAQELGIDLE